MGLLRVFGKSVRFTFRSKLRFLVFIIIFAIVASFVAFFIDSIDTLQTDRFLDQKGIELRQINEFSVNYEQGQEMLDSILDLNSNSIVIEDHQSYLYMDLDSSIRMYSINVDKPWMSRDVNPSYMETGRFPISENEIMVPHGSYQLRNSSADVIIKTDIVVGQSIIFDHEGEELEMVIVGTFNTNNLLIPLDIDTSLWLFMDFGSYEDVVELYSLTLEVSFYYSLSVTVPGYVLSTATYDSIASLNEAIRDLINSEEAAAVGEWISPTSVPVPKAVEDAYRLLLSLAYAVLGGIVLTTLFAYLITRFRRKEIAILKAMGYSNRSVRTSLIAEIMTTSIVGYFLGLGSVQAILYYLSDFNLSGILRFQSVSISFLIIVVITFPGIILTSLRILSVSPAEAFRTGAN